MGGSAAADDTGGRGGTGIGAEASMFAVAGAVPPGNVVFGDDILWEEIFFGKFKTCYLVYEDII